MIYKGDKRISAIYRGGRAITAVYHGERPVWSKLRPYIKGTATGNFSLYIPYPDKNYQSKDINITVRNGEFKEYLPTPFRGEQISLGCMLEEASDVTSVEFGGFDGVKFDNMQGFAYMCEDLQTADISGVGSCEVVDFGLAFAYCSSLRTVKMRRFRFGEMATMEYAFNADRSVMGSISKLTSIDFAGTDFSNVASFSDCFYHCAALTTIIGTVTGIRENIDFTNSPLTAQSAKVIINGLAQVSSKKVLRLNNTTYNALSSADKAIATSKGWTVTVI